jgi:ABC-2 type transport system ATP-binding protein
MPPEPYVQVRGLGKRYGQAWAVRGVTFDVGRGEILGIVGPNGAGKTTTLKMLAGLLEPTEGAARAGGRDVGEAEHRARTGYLPEDSPLYEDMTPLAYLRFFADLYGVPRRLAEERIEAALQGLRLEVRGEKRIGDLSKGMKRKVAIARSLVNDPDLLVYDEPASGLDPLVSAHVLDVLQDLRARGKAIVLSAHNLYHLERICDRVLIVHRGEVAALGTMREMRAQAGGTHYLVHLSVPLPGAKADEGGPWVMVAKDLADVQALEQQARSAGGQLLRVETRDLSLEEIFLRKVAR